MLVSFLGAPCSGKTTAAARLFAELKEGRVVSELITEYARRYIARKRFCHGLDFKLDDDDQEMIMKGQHDDEYIMFHTAPKEVVIISDSSPLNSLMYMSKERRNSKQVLEMVQETIKNLDVAFICTPIVNVIGEDPNRIHGFDESVLLQQELEKVLKEFAPTLKIVPLYGDAKFRNMETIRTVTDIMAQF